MNSPGKEVCKHIAENDQLMLWCPGCEMHHIVTLDKSSGRGWDWNGSLTAPTVTPSLKVTYSWGEEEKKNICHSFIRDGMWDFLTDCTHKLAGTKHPVELKPKVC